MRLRETELAHAWHANPSLRLRLSEASDCHYCCCVASYPWACRKTVTVNNSAATRNTCARCAHPGQFEYAGARSDSQLLTQCYEKCRVDCCSPCSDGQAKLLKTPILNHIPRAVTIYDDRHRTRTAPAKYEHNSKRARHSNPPDDDDL